MSDLAEVTEKLFAIADQLDVVVSRFKKKAIAEPIKLVRDAANQVGQAWSGGWLGYHSRVYYADFQPVPAGAHFSIEWGMDTMHVSQPTVGDWYEYTFDAVTQQIFLMAKVRSLDQATNVAKQAASEFQEAREEFFSVLTLVMAQKEDAFVGRLKAQAEELKITSAVEFARALQPRGQFITRDQAAVDGGIRTPPHLTLIAEVCAIENVSKSCETLGKLARRAASHLDIRSRQTAEKKRIGTNVFLGHGHSLAWRDLKDFIQERIGLPWDEFNRVPVAGITNIMRLSQMLDDAAIAFLILTGEDELADSTVQLRLNVVHEAGLFQGRLGFSKAIVLLEEGCEGFSNIEGLGQIRFPKGNITAVFEEIRRVLEREGLVET